MKKIHSNVEYYQSLLKNTEILVAEHEFVYDDQGVGVDYKYLYANKAFCDIHKVILDDLIGKTVLEVFPEKEKYWIDKYYEVVRTGVPLKMTRYIKQFNNYYSVYAYKSRDNCFIINLTDITDVLGSMKHDKKSMIKTMETKGSSKAALVEIDILRKKIFGSDALSELLGVDAIQYEFIHTTLLKLVHPNNYDETKYIVQQVLKGDLIEIETELRMYNAKRNKYIWVSLDVFAMRFSKSGKPIRYNGIIKDIDLEKMQLSEFYEGEDLFREARNVANLATFIYDVEKAEFESSQELNDFTGIDDLRTIEQYREILHPEDIEEYDAATKHTLAKGKGKVAMYRIIKDEKLKYIQSSVFAKSDDKGNVIKVYGILKDITEIERERRLAVNNQRSFELIFNSSPAGIFLLDSSLEITMENRGFREFLKTKKGEMKLKTLLGDHYNQVITDLKKGKEVNHLRVKHFVSKKWKYFVINIVKIAEEFTNDFEGTLVDVTQQVADEERILYLATHDVLTGLYNRNYFEEIVVEKQGKYPLGLVLCDIDGLKLINDAFGHLKGDELLQRLAYSLKDLSPDNISARIGGDEFALLVDNASDEMLENIELEIKESIKDLGLFGIDFEVSFGYAIIDEKQKDFAKGFNFAENMMYRRKLTDRSSRKSNALTTIMETLHEKTEETLSHCQRVGDYSSMLLYESGFKRTIDLEDIRFLSDVHDIGKIVTPITTLCKKGSLTKEEYEQIKNHSEAGYKIIKNIIDNPNIAFGILYHHERYDGTGYPHGLIGEEIPLYARVLAIADAYDTMVRGRVYQLPITKEAALEEIELNSGTQFDPNLSKTFIKIMKKKNEKKQFV